MTRKIGTTFILRNGKELKVTGQNYGCCGCYFLDAPNNLCGNYDDSDITGECPKRVFRELINKEFKFLK